ncbi:MAG: hypothetical protein LUQ50_04070, partial [Methanospirillum sp.]|nr:hypothetical protein [Methanospirillum sp.]
GWGLFFAREVLDLTNMSISESGIYGIGAQFIITAPDGIFRTPPGTVMNKERTTSSHQLSTGPSSLQLDRDSEGDPGDQEHNH